jgi:hypothetical protein
LYPTSSKPLLITNQVLGRNCSDVDLTAGAVDAAGERACGFAELGRLSPVDGVCLVVEDLECGDRREDFLLDDWCAEVLGFDQVGPAGGTGG